MTDVWRSAVDRRSLWPAWTVLALVSGAMAARYPVFLGEAICVALVCAVNVVLLRFRARESARLLPVLLLDLAFSRYWLLPWIAGTRAVSMSEGAVVVAGFAAACIGWRLARRSVALLVVRRTREPSVAAVRRISWIGCSAAALALYLSARSGGSYGDVSISGDGTRGLAMSIAYASLIAIVAARPSVTTRLTTVLALLVAAATIAGGFRGSVVVLAVFLAFWSRNRSRVEGTRARVSTVAVASVSLVAIAILAWAPVEEGRTDAIEQGRTFSASDLGAPEVPTREQLKRLAHRMELASVHRLALAGSSERLSERSITDYVAQPIGVAVLPRQVWSSKPVFDDGRALSHELFGLPRDTLSSSTVGWPGELWLAGGWSLVVLVPLAYGAFIRTLLELFARRGAWLRDAGVALLLFSLIDGESLLIPWLGGIIRAMIIIAALILVTTRSNSERRPSGG